MAHDRLGAVTHMQNITQNFQKNTLNIRNLDFSGASGLPNSLREALLRANLGDAALLLDACLMSGLRVGKRFTLRKIRMLFIQENIHVTDGVLRRGLGCGIFSGRKLKSDRRGRPEIEYTMPEVLPLVNHYADGVWSPCDELDRADFESLKAYRLALHREFIYRRPGVYSRAFLAERLGVGKATTRNYDRAAGVEVNERFNERRIDHYQNWGDLVRAARKGREWLRLKFADGTVRDMPLKVGIVWRYIQEAAVYLVTQITNEYSLHDEHYQRMKPVQVAY